MLQKTIVVLMNIYPTVTADHVTLNFINLKLLETSTTSSAKLCFIDFSAMLALPRNIVLQK